MKNFFYFILIIFAFSACKSKEEGFVIEGKINDLKNPTLYFATIFSKESDSLRIDTIQVKKGGAFSLRGNAEKLSQVVIYMEDKTVWATVWVQNNEKIKVSGSALYPELILSQGNSVNDLLTKFKTANKALLRERWDLIEKQKGEEPQADSIKIALKDSQFESKLSNINHLIKEKAEEFISGHLNSLASLVLIQDYLVDLADISQVQNLLSKITGDAAISELFEGLKKMSQQVAQANVGSKAPDFKVLDINNDTIQLSQLKGKYFLLSFMASWCETCKKENEELIQLRKKYNKDILRMITVSVDENVSDWKSFVKENKISWIQIVDDKGYSSEIVNLYNIANVPALIFMDKDRRIIGKDLPVDSISKILEKKEEISK